MTTQHAPKSIGSALFGITLVIFLRDVAEVLDFAVSRSTHGWSVASLRRRPAPGFQARLGDITMRFMMLVKSAENSGRPPKELMDAMAKLSEEAAKANTMVDSGGLAPTAMSQRVRLSRGNLTVLDGPFTEAKEVVGGYAQFEFKTKEEATEAAVRFMELHQRHWPGWEGETEIRQVFEPGKRPIG